MGSLSGSSGPQGCVRCSPQSWRPWATGWTVRCSWPDSLDETGEIHGSWSSGAQSSRRFSIVNSLHTVERPAMQVTFIPDGSHGFVGTSRALVRRALLKILFRRYVMDRIENDNSDSEKKAGLKILVADDDPLNQRLMQVLLGREGHEVAVASNG